MTTSFENSRGPYDELPKHMSSLTWFRPGLNSLSNSVAHRSKRHCNLCWDTSLVKSVRITTWVSSRLFAGRSHDVGANSGQSHHTSSPIGYFHSDPSLHYSTSSSLFWLIPPLFEMSFCLFWRVMLSPHFRKWVSIAFESCSREAELNRIEAPHDYSETLPRGKWHLGMEISCEVHTPTRWWEPRSDISELGVKTCRSTICASVRWLLW